MNAHPCLDEFFLRTYETLRYVETDGLGRVDSTTLPALLESGRVELLERRPWQCATANFVISRLEIDYFAEVLWPGTVEIGTSVREIGCSLVAVSQAVFQSGRLVATAQTVFAYVDNGTREPIPLPEAARAELIERFLK